MDDAFLKKLKAYVAAEVDFAIAAYDQEIHEHYRGDLPELAKERDAAWDELTARAAASTKEG